MEKYHKMQQIFMETALTNYQRDNRINENKHINEINTNKSVRKLPSNTWYKLQHVTKLQTG